MLQCNRQDEQLQLQLRSGAWGHVASAAGAVPPCRDDATSLITIAYDHFTVDSTPRLPGTLEEGRVVTEPARKSVMPLAFWPQVEALS